MGRNRKPWIFSRVRFERGADGEIRTIVVTMSRLWELAHRLCQWCDRKGRSS